MLSTNKRKIHFEVSERKILLRIVDLLVVLTSLYWVGVIFDFRYFELDWNNFYWIGILFVYISFFGTVFNMYHLPATTNRLQVIQGVFLTTSATVLLYLLTPIFTPSLPHNRTQILYFYLAIFMALLLWRIFYMVFLASHRFMKKSILICKASQFEKLAESLEKSDPHYRVIGFVKTDASEEDIKSKEVQTLAIQEVEDFIYKRGIYEIIVAPNVNAASVHSCLLQLMEQGISVKDYLHAYEHLAYKIPVDLIEDDFYRYFPFNRSNNNKLYLFAVRLGEILFSLVGLFFSTFLLLPIILIGNLIGNRGSLFYTQDRVGKHGKEFRIIKFRTMVKDAEKDGAVFAQKNDMRITPFGKFLRKSRIDELPQLINVLKGEMAVIGPRPERAYFVEKITQAMPFYPARHAIKPGLTGWAQVNYRYGDSIDDSVEKLKFDLFYIKHRSILLDANIVVKTIGTVLFYKGQ